MLFRGLAKILLLLAVLAVVPIIASATNDNGSAGQEGQRDAPRYTRQMIVIVIDGLQADVLQKVQAPNINGVAASGIRVSQAITPFPGTLEAAVGSLLTGCDPQLHKFVNGNDWLAEPTILKLMEQKNIKTAFFDATGRLGRFADESKLYRKYGNDREIVEDAVKVMADKTPYLSVLVFGEVGKALAESGPNSQAYAKAVTDADNRVGELLRYLHGKGMYDHALIAVCGTTGQPALVLKSPQFKGGVILPPASLTDFAPTLGYIVGERLPEATGLVLWNAFEPGSFQNGIYLMEQRIKDLSNAQLRAAREIADLRSGEAQVQKERTIISQERKTTQEAIAERERRIGILGGIVKTLIGLIAVLIILALAGYYIQYRYLKKKFLLF
ncbi:MAG: alkaline phosphatase family protein [Bacillota bacterium]